MNDGKISGRETRYMFPEPTADMPRTEAFCESVPSFAERLPSVRLVLEVVDPGNLDEVRYPDAEEGAITEGDIALDELRLHAEMWGLNVIGWKVERAYEGTPE